MEVAVQNIVESIRPIVDVDAGWDYCVVWKLGEDQRFLEWMGCCCGGSRSCVENAGDQESLIPDLAPSCRDTMLPHLRTTEACHLLAQLPSSRPLDSGVYTQTLMSNQPAWLNLNFSSANSLLPHSEVDVAAPGTRVLVPVPIGIIELFTTKNVQENHQVVNFIIAQFQASLEQHIIMMNSDNNLTTPLDFSTAATAILESQMSLPHDITAERIKLTDSPANNINYFQQFNYSHHVDQEAAGNANGSGLFNIEGAVNKSSGLELTAAGQADLDGLVQRSRQGTGRSNSNSDCSDQNDEEDDAIRPMKRGGKGQAKNLVAERKRRKKLNERMYALRALVPRISKLDRASILGDAIEFVKELKEQVEDLQHELEDEEEEGPPHSEEQLDHTNKLPTNIINNNNNINVVNFRVRSGRPDKQSAGACINQTGEIMSIGPESSHTNNNNDKLRQMEPQVEVVQLYGNELYVKIFCEHKMGGFVRLMEALDCLGLEVTNVNITNFRSLVSNVFKVERRDCETINVDHIRESLLEIMRNPCGSSGWQEMMMMTKLTHENGTRDDMINYGSQHQSQYHPAHSRLQHCDQPFQNLQNN